MNMIEDYSFNNIKIILTIVLALFYFSLLLAEQKYPLRKRTHSLFSRMVINFTFTILVYIVAALLISPLAKFTIDTTKFHHFGLLHLLPHNLLLQFLLGFLIMDLTFYYWHRMNHEIPLLWRFHNVHHADPDLDVTTSMRFHFFEIAYSSIFRLIQLGLIGINPFTFFCYEFVFQANTFFHHSNIKLPIRVERAINKIIVTPRMHGIHHSNYREETNRNYGVVFSFWDRLHKSIKLNISQQWITIGIPAYSKSSDNSLVNLLLMPIKAQRHYWKIGNRTHINRTLDKSETKAHHLLE